MGENIILGIIQARLGSSRLPGKALKEIMGKPLLWYQCERMRASEPIQKVVIASVDDEFNRPIAEFAKANGIDFFLGSENDLIDRIYRTAKTFKGDVLVRVGADCPLADPEVIDKAIRLYWENPQTYDYVTNGVKRTYPDGLDVSVVPFRTVERLWRELEDPYWREWFSSYIFKHPQEYRVGIIENDKDLSHLRWTVDYQEDFEFVREVFERLYPHKRIFLKDDILELLKQEPWMNEINAKHINKNIGQELAKEAEQ